MSLSVPAAAGSIVTAATEAAIATVPFQTSPGDLIVVLCLLGTNLSVGATTLAITDTFAGGGLTWTSQAVATNGAVGNLAIAQIWTAVSAGNTGNVTVTPSRTGATNSGMHLSAWLIHGVQTRGLQVRATASTTGTLTVPLSAAPAATSEVLTGFVTINGSDPATTIPAGHTSLFTDTHVGSVMYATSSYKNTSAAQSSVFGGGAGANGAGVAIEILTGPPIALSVVNDFAGTPYGSIVPVWTNNTADVAAGLGFDPIQVSWGRQDQFSEVNPTQASVTYRNADGNYTASRSGLRSNLLPPDVAAPGCVTAQVATTFITGGATFVWDNTGQLTGNRSSIKATVPAGQTIGSTPLATAGAFPVTVGLPYSASVQIKNTAPTSGAALMIVWLNSGLGIISAVTGSTVAAGATGYSTVSNAAAPAGAAYAELFITLTTAVPGAPIIWYLSNWELEQATSPAFEQVAAFYPYVRRRVRRRIVAHAGGIVVNLADTFTDSWNVVPSRQGMWVSQQSGTDILGRFGTDTPLRGWLTEEMLVDSPSALYPLQEAEGSASFGDVTGQQQVPASVVNSKYGPGVVTAGQDPNGGLLNSTVVAVTNPTSGNAGSWIGLPLSALGPGFSLEVWVKFPAPGTANSAFVANVSSGLQLRLTQIGASANLNYTLSDTASPTANANVFQTIAFDGKTHQVAVTLAADLKTLSVYFDGALIGQNVSTSVFVSTFAAGAVMALGMIPTTVLPSGGFTGGFAYAALYPTALNATRILAHYNAGATAFTGESTDAHVNRLLTYRPNLGRAGAGSSGFIGSQDGATDIATALLGTGAAEGTVVYIDGKGRVVLRNRTDVFNPTPVLTLNCDTDFVTLDSQFRDDIQGMVNDVTVSRTGGADQRVYDAASVALDGQATESYTIDVDSDQHALDLAGWILANGKREQVLIPGLSIDLLQAPDAVRTAVLQLRPLDCVTVTNLPAPAPASSMTVQIQGGSLSLGSDAMTANLNGTLTPVAVAMWDSSLWDANPPVWAF